MGWAALQGQGVPWPHIMWSLGPGLLGGSASPKSALGHAGLREGPPCGPAPAPASPAGRTAVCAPPTGGSSV